MLVFFGETRRSSHIGLLAGRASARKLFSSRDLRASGLASGLGMIPGLQGYFKMTIEGIGSEGVKGIATLAGCPLISIYRAIFLDSRRESQNSRREFSQA